jgi:maltose alpha-D-glucosyltransferase/alpha-amylase
MNGVTRGPAVITIPDRPAPTAARPLPTEPEWYRRAVFYEVLVRSFSDSDDDGCGDLRGLIGRLDYLAWLGVDCLWLPPFYASPLRDGGYDISDFRQVLPSLGTLEDFIEMLDAAHALNIRVIVDMVMNHTSDQHAWFQASRRDPDGPYGDFYVWRDDDTGYRDARIIFIDTENSNWAFDPVRRQYYWHRFFSHQPDLNFDNPAVQDAMIDVLRFWLDLGVDGFRLDAVPYLFEREGTNGENLPETHGYLRRVRAVIDQEYPGRLLLAEANQWPEDVVHYLGSPDGVHAECHMAFHFPLMPRLFMALRQESSTPVREIMARTPDLPEGAQWGIFLRNHDELTLEMVSDVERDYMYAEYAEHPRMRANMGIRRRLAPLVNHDRRQLELLTGLLLSLPGSPILYYGDEIGMADNIWLSDRDGVRTPMQWTPDRNAGFSGGDPGRLLLPLIADPTGGYQVVNVEAQLANPSSLLHWTKRLLHIRKANPVFGMGDYVDVAGDNDRVFAFRRTWTTPDGDHVDILCVNNMSRSPQPVALDLRGHDGWRPVEILGGAEFPRVGTGPYPVTLAGHGFYWFRLHAPVPATASAPVAAATAVAA